MAKEKKNVILDLSTKVPDRPIIRIDGKDYYLAVPDDFVFAEFMWLAREGQKFSGLTMQEDINGELEDQLDKLTRKAFFDIPDEVFGKLNSLYKAQVLSLFLEAVEGTGGNLRRLTRRKSMRKKSSPGSKGSTAGQ